MILLADTVLVGREWVQLSLADLQARTGLARRTVQRQLDALEADRLLRRDHREGRPNANASRADRYALNIDALASRPEEEAAPTRGPTKEKPDEASPSPGTIVDSPLSDKSGESSGTDQL
jgi:DNA-binding transcriptional ArsR family regulator